MSTCLHELLRDIPEVQFINYFSTRPHNTVRLRVSLKVRTCANLLRWLIVNEYFLVESTIQHNEAPPKSIFLHCAALQELFINVKFRAQCRHFSCHLKYYSLFLSLSPPDRRWVINWMGFGKQRLIKERTNKFSHHILCPNDIQSRNRHIQVWTVAATPDCSIRPCYGMMIWNTVRSLIHSRNLQDEASKTNAKENSWTQAKGKERWLKKCIYQMSDNFYPLAHTGWITEKA
jgi:hypothetical protein